MRVRALLSVAVLAWSAAACTGGSEPAGTASPARTSAGPSTSPLRFGATPLWSERTKGVPRYADHFALHGDSVVVVSGPRRSESDRLSVLDAATGEVRWSIRIWRPLRGGHGDRWNGLDPSGTTPPVVDRGGDWGVLVETSQNHASTQEPYGLALLSGEDGRVLWRRTVVAEKKSGDRNKRVYPDLVLGDTSIALMHLRTSLNPMVTDTRLVAVDPRTGRRLWSRSGVAPAAVVSGTVVAAEWPDPARTPYGSAANGTVAVLDPATGQDRWSLRDRMPAARVMAAINGLVVVSDPRRAPVLLDLATGVQVGSLPGQAGNCSDDRANLIACESLSSTSGLLTIAAGERTARPAAHRPPEGIITLVRDGRIYFSGVNSPGAEIDRSGTPLTGPLPAGFLGALSDRYAVFRIPVTQQYSVYGAG
ncbi:PQQ-binding-like beta-propeller repeat protein [Actinomadura sp. DC4]|uniref:outer membrane protein assembly factor BamB family protein n=1 Tax=Actinomadura sp. DC4 TaxID=3055069 RepID=UPI0025B197A3|nr:PQQ-binding-like beta-propeller repeat protein [Actinomadura sp. DC4]MDN3358624.1 PQQ-binding-like beta-propeller repeat protein [Actinomadura sp. DC4]